MIGAPSTLYRYINRQFLAHFFILLGALLALILVFDIIEFLRRTANLPQISFGLILSMSFLKLPYLGERILPLSILFAAIYTCWKLNRTSELVVIRASGISVWQFLSPMILAALVMGVLATTVINPISSTFLGKFQQLDRLHFNNEKNLISISKTGIWLRQPTAEGYALIHSETFNKEEWLLENVTILFFDGEDGFVRRMDSPVTYLKPGTWDIRAPLVTERGKSAKPDTFSLPTDLTSQKIEETFADTDTISFWNLREHEKVMEETGFPSIRLSLRFHSLLAQPVLFCALILLAATFSLRPTRFGNTGIMIVLGVGVGFLIFFLESMLQAFGGSQKIPLFLAAWTPALASLLLGVTTLLHLEDG